MSISLSLLHFLSNHSINKINCVIHFILLCWVSFSVCFVVVDGGGIVVVGGVCVFHYFFLRCTFLASM